MTEYFDFQNLFPLSVGEREWGEVESIQPRDGNVGPMVDVPIFRLCRCILVDPGFNFWQGNFSFEAKE